MPTRRELLNGAAYGLAAILAAGAFLPIAGLAATDDPVTHTDAEWRKILTADQYAVLQQEGTERPFTSPLLHESARELSPARDATCRFFPRRRSSTAARMAELLGAYRQCRQHETGQFVQHDAKPPSCAGAAPDISGMSSTIGPKPTGLRYCVNGLAMKFAPDAA